MDDRGQQPSKRAGSLDVIAGGMRSAKTDRLLIKVERLMIAGMNAQMFKHFMDKRGPADMIVSRTGRKMPATTVKGHLKMERLVRADTQVVGIDEAQFFNRGLVGAVTRLADSGILVIVAGLDMDFNRKPFGPMPYLMAVAESPKVRAVCMGCGEDASYSYNTIGGEEQIQIGDKKYVPLCRTCYLAAQEEKHT